jgi:hypothetical protein
MNVPEIIKCAWWVDYTVHDLQVSLENTQADINAQYPPLGYTLCHYAASGDWPETEDGRFMYLLGLRPNVELRSWTLSDWARGLDWTVLMVACRHGTLDKVAALINYGADVNVLDSAGRTPLMAAQFGCDAQAKIKLLLSAGADSTVRDKDGYTVWDYQDKCPPM